MLKSPSDDAHSPRRRLTVVCSGWKRLHKNTLLGFAKIRIVELDLTIRDIAIHRKGERLWAQLPARPKIIDGALVINDSGKVQYATLLEFGRRAVADAFSQRVIDAVLRFDRDALDLGKGAA